VTRPCVTMAKDVSPAVGGSHDGCDSRLQKRRHILLTVAGIDVNETREAARESRRWLAGIVVVRE